MRNNEFKDEPPKYIYYGKIFCRSKLGINIFLTDVY